MQLIEYKKIEQYPYEYSVCFSINKKNIYYFDKYLQVIGNIRIKYYDLSSHSWLVDKAGFGMLEHLDNKIFNKTISNNILQQASVIKNNNVDAFYQVTDYESIGTDMKLKPFDYQKRAIKMALNNQCSIIMSPCGSGKTCMGIGIYLEALKSNSIKAPGLIVVKATLKSQWRDEIRKFSSLTPFIVNTPVEAKRIHKSIIRNKKKRLKQSSNNEQSDALQKELSSLQSITSPFDNQFSNNVDLYILNYETLRNQDVLNKLKEINPEFIFCDEVHYIKNYNSARAKAVYDFNTAKIRIGATATPIQKDPRDIYGLFKFVNPELFPSLSKFNRTFVKWGGRGIVIGALNEKTLYRMISPYLVSIPTEEVSKQLPKLVVSQRYCEFTPEQEEINEKLMNEIQELKDKEENLLATLTEAEAKTNIEIQQIEAKILMRQTFAQELADTEALLSLSDSQIAQNYITGSHSNKMEILLDLLEEIISSGEKVCIFSRFSKMQNIISQLVSKEAQKSNSIFKGIKLAYIRGDLSSDIRYQEIQNFKTKDEYKILCCSNAATEGVNLSNCKYMIEIDLAESYALQTQRHGRLERADSIHNTVFVYQLITKNSWDEIALKIISKKQYYDNTIVKGNFEQ